MLFRSLNWWLNIPTSFYTTRNEGRAHSPKLRAVGTTWLGGAVTRVRSLWRDRCPITIDLAPAIYIGFSFDGVSLVQSYHCKYMLRCRGSVDWLGSIEALHRKTSWTHQWAAKQGILNPMINNAIWSTCLKNHITNANTWNSNLGTRCNV